MIQDANGQVHQSSKIAMTLFISRLAFVGGLISMFVGLEDVFLASFLVMSVCFLTLYFSRCPDCGDRLGANEFTCPKTPGQFLSPFWPGRRCKKEIR